MGDDVTTAPPTRRVRMTVAYDGSAYHGFAAQPGLTTVAGTLETNLSRVLRVPRVELTCAGRTDRGVHGWGQVVSFDVPASQLDRSGDPSDLLALRKALNQLCGPAVVVRDAAVVDDGFDARFSARSRLYRYTIVNCPVPDPFLVTTAWHVTTPLDVRAMTAACDPLIGQHDFSSFCRRPPTEPGIEPVPLVRRVRAARWERGGPSGRPSGESGVPGTSGEQVLHFWIEANAFCHQMVRAVVGTLVEVGRGKKTAGDIMGILAARDRRAAGDLAPPHGLCLWAVRYDEQHGHDQHGHDDHVHVDPGVAPGP